MKKSTDIITVETDYDARLAPEKRAAKVELLAGFVADMKASKSAAEESMAQGKLAINKMWEGGKKWVLAGDKNQFDMPFYNHADTLVPVKDREFTTAIIVKTALHLAETMTKPVKTDADAAQHIQKVLIAFDIREKPERMVSAGATKNNWGELIPVETGKYNHFLLSLFEQEPVASWTPDREDTFLAQTELIEKTRDEVKAKKASRLLKERGEA